MGLPRLIFPVNIFKKKRTVSLDSMAVGPFASQVHAYLPNNGVDMHDWLAELLVSGELEIAGPYISDAEAANNDVELEGIYQLAEDNIYGMPFGVLKIRKD